MGGNDISKVDLRILDSVGEGRHLRTEFALSTVATVITLCRGAYPGIFTYSGRR